MSEIQQSDADRYGNNCTRYTHADGYPMPEASYCCRGCKHSHDPYLYDSGCTHPDGFLPREQKGKLTASEKRKLSNIIKRVNESAMHGRLSDAEYR